jgi:hypothetical protein
LGPIEPQNSCKREAGRSVRERQEKRERGKDRRGRNAVAMSSRMLGTSRTENI